MIPHLALHIVVKVVRGLATALGIRALIVRVAAATFAGLMLGFGFSTAALFGVVYATLWAQRAGAKNAAPAAVRVETAQGPAHTAATPVAVASATFNESPRQRARRLKAERKQAMRRPLVAG